MRQSPPPLVAWHRSCGFPSPADDDREAALESNELVIAHPDAPMYVRGWSDSMEEAGRGEGEVLVGDRALEARENCCTFFLICKQKNGNEDCTI